MAGHDIAFTMIAAILTALQNELYSKPFDVDQLNTNHPQPVVQGCHIQDVIRNIIKVTKVALALFWGEIVFCTRCNGEDHFRQECRVHLSCSYCAASPSAKVRYLARTHKREKCFFALALNLSSVTFTGLTLAQDKVGL